MKRRAVLLTPAEVMLLLSVVRENLEKSAHARAVAAAIGPTVHQRRQLRDIERQLQDVSTAYAIAAAARRSSSPSPKATRS